MSADVNLMVGNETQDKNGKKCRFECKNHIRYCTYEEDYVWNPSTCACKCEKDFEIGEYLKDLEYMKSLVDDTVVTCDEI